MKKTSIIFILCITVLLTACSTTEKQTNIEYTEATGTIEQVETNAILINNFKEKNDKDNPESVIRFSIANKYYDKNGNKIKLTELNKNDNVKIILTKDYPIQETSPGQIDPKYIQKIIRLNK
ncbi:TPA: membrane lipoprotein lipid attachment site-containing protein [Listeria innocua]|uniref:membrane lipoprotein lipid attachment site-containing protein n=1 Tax=Listeria innocua TaxID=1642 RepID=UPI0010EBF9ED|nr:membrane lipoprotein lipid attachment site-containing protein [Listeria innocua]MBF2410207.1 membrane lipoprotein lipid attachment site-containing protein [Listeria innocua]MDH4597947.1 membrane lipoprotein lipid attachment site-containing protein [Listeria innocua]MDH4684190.1 membrane lipoprotein lipid attachment site-containing protein [Listeria innocua]MDH4903167.1 membrane lipoprotein lipid attachment site-containing protein [Listeria innocua]HBM3472225.1 membrane lipoprotein lipid att